MRRAARELWWALRGVAKYEYRKTCRRCNATGQTHFALWTGERYCWRFAAKETT